MDAKICMIVLILSTVWLDVVGIVIKNLPKTNYQEPGDLNIGVLIPVHEYAREGFCSRKVRDLGVLQRIEAIAQVLS